MYKIEQFLLEHGFKKKKLWDSGVVVYTNRDEESAYVVDVAIWTDKCTRHQRVWEATIFNPYGITLNDHANYDEKEYTETHRALSDDHVDYSFRFQEWLREVENPWEVIE